MNTNMNPNITIEYDTDILSKIKEMIESGFDKLKSFVKSEKNNFEIYKDLDKKFNEIALKLEKYEFLNDELNYFLSISDKILYIIYHNCKNSSFGHYDFALCLFDFFIELWNTKIKLITDFSDLEIEKYEQFKIDFKRRYGKYRHKFYIEIHKPSNEFSEEEIYNMHVNLRG